MFCEYFNPVPCPSVYTDVLNHYDFHSANALMNDKGRQSNCRLLVRILFLRDT